MDNLLTYREQRPKGILGFVENEIDAGFRILFELLLCFLECL
jgi:hypothetical protein